MKPLLFIPFSAFLVLLFCCLDSAVAGPQYSFERPSGTDPSHLLQQHHLAAGDYDDDDIANRPFILPNGRLYRDLLTIQSSKAVAQYAASYQRAQSHRIQQERYNNRLYGKDKVQTPTYVTSRNPLHLLTTGHTFVRGARPRIGSRGRSSVPEIEFRDSRSIRKTADYEKERTVANAEEKEVLIERALEDNLKSGAVADVPLDVEPELPFRKQHNNFPERPRSSSSRIASSTLIPDYGGAYTTTISFGKPQRTTYTSSTEPNALPYDQTIDPRPTYYNQINAPLLTAAPVAAVAPVSAAYSFQYGGGHQVESFASKNGDAFAFGYTVNH